MDASAGDADGDGLSDEDEARLGTDPRNADTDGDGILDGDEVVLGTSPTTADEACAGAVSAASLVKRPADIILVVDNSGSMRAEIEAVERNINENFAQIIEASGIDYKIVVLSSHGDSANRDLCISQPLSDTDCNPPPASPANNARLFHLDEGIASHDSLRKVVETYPEWADALRDDSFRIFIELSDDESTYMDADEFEAELFALGGFGDASRRLYRFHSIVGLAAKPAANQAWEPTEPLQTERCAEGSQDYAEVYQTLSIRTGGLRFPICEHASFDAVFSRLATDVTEQVAVPCTFAPPTPAEGDQLDWDRVAVTYVSGANGQPERLPRFDNAGACSGNGFYLAGDTVELCPTACAAVSADAEAEVRLHVACERAALE